MKKKRNPSYRTMIKREAMQLTREKRQEFLDKMHVGKTVGEAVEECGISVDQGFGIVILNLKKVEYLNTVSV